MDNLQVFTALSLILIRLIIPVGILLLIGEWNRRREAKSLLRNEPRTGFTYQSFVPLRHALEES